MKVSKLVKPLIAVCVVGLAAAYGGSYWISSQRSQVADATVDFSEQAIRRGEYVAQLADCFACHTAPNGQKYAGGLAMQTPIGAIYSTNITPDKKTGIGQYSYADFKAAVQHGVRADKTPLYPAMPYVSYAIMNDADIQALYAYFMKGVAPVKQQNADSTIAPVLNWRWPVAYWQAMFAPNREFAENSQFNPRVNRGKYLVEGAGHCGACHTPRGVAYQEKALSEDGNAFLSGAVIDGWRAKSLRGDARGLASWSVEELSQFFSTGKTERSAAFGAMADVVQHSTRFWQPEDVQAMSEYLKTLPAAPHQEKQLASKPDTTTPLLLSGDYQTRGALLYAEHCMICHRADGNGVSRIFPALNKNTAVIANHPQSVIQITLEGGHSPQTNQDTLQFAMPAFNHLSDEDVAALVNFVRNSWTNQAPEVSSKDVKEIRQFVNQKAPNIVPNAASGVNHE